MECKLTQPLWKTVWSFLKKKKKKQTHKQNKKPGIKSPYDPAIPLLGIYRRKLKLKNTCTPIFIAALFTIAKKWKQLGCQLIDEWIKKIWHIYIHGIYSVIKRKTFVPIPMKWINLETITQNEVT